METPVYYLVFEFFQKKNKVCKMFSTKNHDCQLFQCTVSTIERKFKEEGYARDLPRSGKR